MNSMFRFGLIAALLLSILLLAPYLVFGARPEWMKIGEVIGYASMLLCLSATYFAMRREQRRRGSLRFGHALGIGAGVSAIAGVGFGAATWIFYLMVGDALPEALLAFYADQIRNSGAGVDVIARQLQELEGMRPFFFNLPLQAAVMAATVFVIGLIESLVGAWLVSRVQAAPLTARA
jgi:hypothetical protein